MKLVSRAKLPEEEYDKMIVKHWKVTLIKYQLLLMGTTENIIE